MPTYLVHGEEPRLSGVNIFDYKFELPADAVRDISHGFGAVREGEKGVTLGHIVRNLFLSVPFQPYEHIAFLDTPGYSAPDEANYSPKQTRRLPRQQLNTANYILWFVQANAGTTTEKDLAFLQTLRPDIPKLVILSKADSWPPGEAGGHPKTYSQHDADEKYSGGGCVDFFSNSTGAVSDRGAGSSGSKRSTNPILTTNLLSTSKAFSPNPDFYEERQEQERRRLDVLNAVLTPQPRRGNL